MTTPGKPVFGAGVLRYPQVMSPNFNLQDPMASPAQSWALLQSGLAYLFGVVLTGGTITGPDYIVDPTGFYFYSSNPPAAGNLVQSIGVTTAATDPPGLNAVLPGNTRYHNNGAGVYVAQQSTQSYVAYLWQATSPLGPYTAMSTSVGFTNEFTSSPILELQANSSGGTIQLDDPVTFLSAAAAPPGVIAALWLDNASGWFKLRNAAGGAGIINVDSWHSPSLANSWTGTLIASLKATNLVHVEATLTVPATPAATVTTFTGIYVPVSTKRFQAFMFPTGTHAVTPVAGQLTTGGVLQLLSTLTAGDEVTFTFEYPLDV